MTAGATHQCTPRVQVPAAALFVGRISSCTPHLSQSRRQSRLAPPFNGGAFTRRALTCLSHQASFKRRVTVTFLSSSSLLCSHIFHLVIARFPIDSRYYNTLHPSSRSNPRLFYPAGAHSTFNWLHQRAPASELHSYLGSALQNPLLRRISEPCFSPAAVANRASSSSRVPWSSLHLPRENQTHHLTSLSQKPIQDHILNLRSAFNP